MALSTLMRFRKSPFSVSWKRIKKIFVHTSVLPRFWPSTLDHRKPMMQRQLWTKCTLRSVATSVNVNQKQEVGCQLFENDLEFLSPICRFAFSARILVIYRLKMAADRYSCWNMYMRVDFLSQINSISSGLFWNVIFDNASKWNRKLTISPFRP